ncbi:MAG: methylmalonyl-CoA epimerase [Alphaproteobacteria bacterium]|nr:methylmalonyl-CoA epimerase [Alphaproteobacteria bacterium]
MLGKLNHVAIVVKDVNAAAAVYRDTLGAQVSEPKAHPEHGMTVISVNLPNTSIELQQPLGADSPLSNFLLTHADGGIHHICYEVADIFASRDKLVEQGARVLGGAEPKTGPHGKLTLFLHPKDFCGTLIELEQA